MKIQDFLRAEHTLRWTTVHMTKQQSVAEHSFNVTMIAIEMGNRLSFGMNDMAMLTYSALVHDLEEVVTGDIPSPTKKRIEKSTPIPIPDEVGVFHTSSCRLIEVIKTADKLETLAFIMQYGINYHAKQVQDSLAEDWGKYVKGIDNDLADVAQSLLHDIISGSRTW